MGNACRGSVGNNRYFGSYSGGLPSVSSSFSSYSTRSDLDSSGNMRRGDGDGGGGIWVLGHKTATLRELYTIGRKLGQGQFGTTYLCTETATGRDYACKSISKRKLLAKEDVEDVRREIQIMHHLSGHRNVVTIKGAYEDSVYVHIVMELCEGGELFDRIIQRGHYSERKAAELTRIVVGVVEACHSLGVMHRDLKPENFLLSNKDDDSSLKAIDFGLSVFFKPGQVFTDVVGSPYYVAPEVLCKHYGPAADVWTAGVILYILLSGVPPFWAETQQGIFDAVLKGTIDFESEPWPMISESAKDIIRKMLCSCPSDRLTAHEVLCHPWVCENGVAPDHSLDPAVLSRLKQFSAMNKLKKMALRVIAESLSEEEIAGLKEIFQAIDTDNSGAITFDELKEGLRKYGSNLQECEIRALMDAADIDNSGSIDYMEFIAATIHVNKLEREEHLTAAFAYFDKDGSGYITVDELQQACKDQNISDAFIEDVIKEVDQDNDGRIDYGEFVAMMRKGNMNTGLERRMTMRSMRNSINISAAAGSSPRAQLYSTTPGSSPRAQINSAAVGSSPRAQLNSFVAGSSPRARFNSAAVTSSPKAQLNSAATGSSPRAQLNSSVAGSSPRSRFNSAAVTSSPKAQLNGAATGSSPRAQLNSSVAGSSPRAQFNSAAATSSPRAQLNSSAATSSPRAQLNSADATSSPRAQLNMN